MSLVGTWDLIGFTDDGVAAQTTGTWTFRSDGSTTINGTVTFPGGPTDDISGDATYEQNGATVILHVGPDSSTVILHVGPDSSTWTLSMSGDVATLTAVEPPPANTITLRRRS
jgi:hypothetical protein